MTFELFQGDAVERLRNCLDQSVDLILTDPLYNRLEDYAWLEREAERVLKPDGNALAFVNSKWLPSVLRTVHTKLPVLTAVQNTGGGMNGRVIAKSYHLVWMGSGVVKRYVADGFVATPWSRPNSHNFKWTKNPKYIGHVIHAFTNEGDLVVDPFAGGGSIGAIALQMERRYLGAEIDREIHKIAFESLRLATEQPRLISESQPK